MEVNQIPRPHTRAGSLRHRISGFGLRFFALMVATWFIVALWHFPTDPIGRLNMLSFAVGAMVLSTWFLHLLGYFSAIRILPRPSDLLWIATAFPAAAVIQFGLTILVFKVFPVSLLEICGTATLSSLAIFGLHRAIEQLLMGQGLKQRIVLLLTTVEREAMLEEFEAHGFSRYLHILSPEEMRGYFARGTENLIDRIVISRGAVRQMIDGADLVRAHLAGIPIVDRRELFAHLSGRIGLHDIDSWSFMVTATQQTPLLRAYSILKTVLEPFLALALAITLTPVMVVVAILIRLDSPGPVFFRQVRRGYLGRDFTLLKFRSMRTDAEANGPQWASAGDSRITRVGRKIRATRLDELPQLWNVIRGEMSFVGPRPELPTLCDRISETVPLFGIRTAIRPGITGWAQVCAGYAASIEESRTKLEFDLYYIKHVSPRIDAIVILKTLLVALIGSERAHTKPVVAVAPAPLAMSLAALADVETQIIAGLTLRPRAPESGERSSEHVS